MTSLSIYDTEQYIFEIVQGFMRPRIIFTSLELNIFDLLLSHNDGISCSDIAKHLNLYYVENQSRCLQDTLDCLTSMNLLERSSKGFHYKLSEFTRKYLLPNRDILTCIDQLFYRNMPQLDTIHLDKSLVDPLNQLMLLRIKELVDLTDYSNISIDLIDTHADAIILWRQDDLLKEKIQQAFNVLPTNGKGLLVLIVPNDEQDEATLALNILMNMVTASEAEAHPKDVYSETFLREVGFNSVIKKQSTDHLQLLMAFK